MGTIQPGIKVAVLALAVIPANLGCLGGGPDEPSRDSGLDAGDGENSAITVPWPREGVTWRYETRDGAWLELTVGGTVERRDAWLQERAGVDLDVVYQTGKYPAHFEETVDTETGLIIQQWARCHTTPRDDGDCPRENGLVLTASGGLPGGLGAGPFWGRTLHPTETTVELRTPLSGNQNVTYTVTKTQNTGSARSCVELEPADLDPGLFVLDFTAGLGPFTLCEGRAFPAEFQTLGDQRFQLTRVEGQPSGSIATSRGKPANPPPPPVARVDRELPLYATHEEVDTNFTTEEAHRIARERVEAYGRLFERGQDTTLVHSLFRETSYRRSDETGLTGSSTTYTRELIAIDASGATVEVIVEKQVERPGRAPGTKETTYRIEETERGQAREPFPIPSGLPSEGANLEEAIQIGEELTGERVGDFPTFGLRATVLGEPWITHDQDWRLSSSSLQIFHEDPSPDRSGGLSVGTPYRSWFDDRTGTVMWLDANRSTLNETMR